MGMQIVFPFFLRRVLCLLRNYSEKNSFTSRFIGNGACIGFTQVAILHLYINCAIG